MSAAHERIPAFSLVIGEARTWAQLSYKLDLIAAEIRKREHYGEIFAPEQNAVESVVSDGPIASWAIHIPASTPITTS